MRNEHSKILQQKATIHITLIIYMKQTKEDLAFICILSDLCVDITTRDMHEKRILIIQEWLKYVITKNF